MMRMRRTTSISRIAILLVFLVITAVAQSNYQATPENLKARQEFQDDKFGMFIHWGVYSVLGDGEWVFHNRKLTLQEYERVPQFFDPEKFDAKAWVSLAKAAGMKYITITSRHHDGFAMFDSKVSDWNIVQRTPYAKDPLKMLADEYRHRIRYISGSAKEQFDLSAVLIRPDGMIAWAADNDADCSELQKAAARWFAI